jgi:hypothetical protein
MGQVGCLLTAAAMALKAAGAMNIYNKYGVAQGFDPYVLNEFMSNTFDLSMPGGRFFINGGVNLAVTAQKVGANIAAITHSPSSFQFDSSLGVWNSTLSQPQAYEALDKALCEEHKPMIVQVTSDHGEHYVLVKAKEGSATDGSQYQIEDPGSGSNTSLRNYHNGFTTIGFMKDPPDISEIDVAVDDNADIILIDQNGRRTGFDSSTGQVLREIPLSTHMRMHLADDETGDPGTGISHSVQILKPAQGTYQIVVSGLQLGTYMLTVDTYAQDGTASAQPLIQGVAAAGSKTNFQIHFSSSAGGVSTVVRIATFQSTLTDIDNSFRLNLIENQGLANSLSQKI